MRLIRAVSTGIQAIRSYENFGNLLEEFETDLKPPQHCGYIMAVLTNFLFILIIDKDGKSKRLYGIGITDLPFVAREVWALYSTLLLEIEKKFHQYNSKILLRLNINISLHL